MNHPAFHHFILQATFRADSPLRAILLSSFILLASTFPAAAQARLSTNYALAPEAIAASSGNRSTSANYTLDSTAGLSPAALSTSANYVAKSGFAGQLYDPTGIVLAAASDPADETATVQLSADLTLDDDTVFPGATDSVAWSVVSGPFTGIDSAGLASTDIVFEDTVATARATLGALMQDLNVTVADIDSDNFGTYAGDSLDDDWQVNFFGLPPNADAAPGANPDGDIHDNKFEFLSGFDPTDRNAFLTFIVSKKSGSTVDLQLSKMIPGTDYKLFSSSNLVFPATPDNTFTVGSETLDALVQDAGATGPTKYYRVELEKQ